MNYIYIVLRNLNKEFIFSTKSKSCTSIFMNRIFHDKHLLEKLEANEDEERTVKQIKSYRKI